MTVNFLSQLSRVSYRCLLALFPTYRSGLNEFGNPNIEAIEEVSHDAATKRIDEFPGPLVAEMLVPEMTHPLVGRDVCANLIHLNIEWDGVLCMVPLSGNRKGVVQPRGKRGGD